MKKYIIKISGMHCTSCAMLIENALEDATGVEQANCNYAQAQCEAETEDSFNPETFQEIIKKEGYKVEEIKNGQND